VYKRWAGGGGGGGGAGGGGGGGGGGGLATPPMFSVWSDSFYVKVGRIVLKNWENLLKNY
jgi:hypothetical protein